MPSYVSAKQLAEKFGRSTRTIDRWSEDPQSGFPYPFKINNRKYWLAEEIEAFEAAIIQASRRRQPDLSVKQD